MYKVLKSFSGVVVGVKGKIIEIKDNAVATDLLNAEYIEPVEVPPKKTTKKAKA